MRIPFDPAVGRTAVAVHVVVTATQILVAAVAGGWSAERAFGDGAGWPLWTLLLGLPWSIGGLSTTAAWPLFLLSPWLNVAVHAGLWTILTNGRLLRPTPTEAGPTRRGARVAAAYVALHALVVTLLSALPVLETLRPSDDANIGAGLSLALLEGAGLPWSLLPSLGLGGPLDLDVMDLLAPWANVVLHAALWWWVLRRAIGLKERAPSA